MSRVGYYKSPEGQAELKKKLCLSDNPSTKELYTALQLQLGDAEIWAEAEAGEVGHELHTMFGLTIDCEADADAEEGSNMITDYDRHVRLAELHTAIAGLHEMLGSASVFAENDKDWAEREAANKIDRRGAINATKAAG